jgi:hypothetical protein
VSAYQYSQAGPKFSNGNDGSEHEVYVVYSRRPAGGEDPPRSAAFVRYDAGATGCSASNLAACFADAGEVPTEQPQTRAIVYSTEEEALDSAPAKAVYRHRDTAANPPVNELCWIDLEEWLDDSGSETCYAEDSVEWGRIKDIDGELWVVTTIEDGHGRAQAALVSVEDPQVVETLTGGITGAGADPNYAATKFNPITWYDPAMETHMRVVRQHDLNAEQSDIAIWRQEQIIGQGTVWVHHRSFSAEDIGEDMELEPPLVFSLSPEPFVWEGRSYIALSTADALTIDAATDGNIWIVRVPMDNEVLGYSRRVNERSENPEDNRRRVEAESYVLEDAQGNPAEPVIYYSLWEDEDDTGNCQYPTGTAALERLTLHRAETGL